MPLKTDKSVFYYIPRTGSVWVSEMIRVNNKNAKDVTERPAKVKNENYTKYLFGLFNRHTAPKLKDDLFSFCFVRHPIAWYASLWRAVMGRTRGIDQRFALADCWSNSFEEFVSNSLNKYPKGFLTQMYRYFDNVDFIGRHENLREDLITALTLAGEKFDEDMIRNQPAVNVANYNEVELSKELTERITENEKWVIDKFYSI